MDRSREGRAIACERCGASLPMQGLAKHVHCPHCGHGQRIDPAKLAALRGYRDEAGRDLGEVLEHRAAQEDWRGRMRGVQRQSAWAMVVLSPLIIGSALGIVLIPVAHGAGLFDWNALDETVKTSIVAAVAAVAVIVGWGGGAAVLLLGSRRDRVRAAAAPPPPPAPQPPSAGTLLCPRCGGPNDLHVGVATEECSFCHATFAPGEATQAAGLDASERARRKAALERYRQERMTVATHASHGHTTREMPAVVGFAIATAVFGPMFCLFSSVGVIELVTADEPEMSWGGVLGLGLPGLALSVAAVFLGLAARARVRADKRAFEERVRRYRGETIGNLMGTASWLSAHWAGPYELENLWQGPEYIAAHGSMAGYPWLFEMAQQGKRLGSRPGRAQVLVGAFFARAPDPARAPEDAQRMIADLGTRGIRTEVSEAGVRAHLAPVDATPEHVVALRDRLVLLVTRLGGRPVQDD